MSKRYKIDDELQISLRMDSSIWHGDYLTTLPLWGYYNHKNYRNPFQFRIFIPLTKFTRRQVDKAYSTGIISDELLHLLRNSILQIRDDVLYYASYYND